MKFESQNSKFELVRERAGSVLIIVLWVAFGLVALALFFANSMSMELRASDNRAAGVEAEQAIAGAARYFSNILATAEEPGTLPDLLLYRHDAVPVGDATFWVIGRDTNDWANGPENAVFGLVDEASKLNLNTASLEMLELLPRMTPDLAAAIIDWRDEDSDITSGGAEDEVYLRLDPPYRCKNAPLESLDELRLVYGIDLELLYGEDMNLNGILDANENDGALTSPNDNRDGRLDPGLLEFCTVYSRQPAGGTNVNDQQTLAPLLQEYLGADRSNEILQNLGGGPGGGPGGGGGAIVFSNLIQFFVASGMTQEEFALVETNLSVTNGVIEGLVNVNTASETVLACIPGIGEEKAGLVVAARRSNSHPGSMGWLVDVLGQEGALEAGPYVTGRSYQYTADIAAVGHYGRGYRRVRFVFDTTDQTPKILYRQDLGQLGWALGRDARQELALLANRRR